MLTDAQIENAAIDAAVDLAQYLENEEIGAALSDDALREIKRHLITFARSLLDETT